MISLVDLNGNLLATRVREGVERLICFITSPTCDEARGNTLDSIFQGDTSAYRSNRSGLGVGTGTFTRNASSGSTLATCRTTYTGIASNSIRDSTKDGTVSGYGSSFLKKDRGEKKGTLKYSCE